MFLISVKCEYRNKIKGKLRKIYNKKITIFTEDDLLYEKYNNYNYVITDYNKEIINYFSKKKKTIFVMDTKKYKYNKNNNDIYYCNSVEEIQKIISEKKKKKTVSLKLVAAVTVLFLFINIFVFILHNSNKMIGSVAESNKTNIQENELNIKKNKIDHKLQNYLFLGDSITEFYNLEDYYDEKLFVVNSGISGNSAYHILDDMYNRVYKYNPTKVFLLIGTNDLSHRTDEEIVNNIFEIVSLIHKHRKKAEVYVESIYPVNNVTEDNDIVIDWMVGDRDNERIKNINKILKENSKKYEYTYLDFYSKLEDENGLLKLDYTIDGLHISDEGYKLITNEIMKIIDGKIEEF